MVEIRDEVPGGDDLVVPFGVADVKRAGTDVTVVAIGYMVRLALAAAARLEETGISTEVIDPRTLVPLDLQTIRSSVKKTGRLVVVEESFPTCSLASEIITAVVEDRASMASLQAPPIRVCTPPVPVPFSPPLEDFVLPGEARIFEAVAASSQNGG